MSRACFINKENVIYILTLTPIIWSTFNSQKVSWGKSKKHKYILKTPYVKYLQRLKCTFIKYKGTDSGTFLEYSSYSW